MNGHWPLLESLLQLRVTNIQLITESSDCSDIEQCYKKHTLLQMYAT